MKPFDLKSIRQACGLSLDAMATLLGYDGEHKRGQVHKMETGERPIRDAQRRLAEAYRDGYRPADWPV